MGKYGGEEFVLLLGSCTLAEAAKVAEKIRQATSILDVQAGADSISISFSAGVVEHRDGEDLAKLVERADKLMYQAKKRGKNLTVSQSK